MKPTKWLSNCNRNRYIIIDEWWYLINKQTKFSIYIIRIWIWLNEYIYRYTYTYTEYSIEIDTHYKICEDIL